MEAGVIPRGTYQASPPVPDRDLPTVSAQAILYTHKDIDEGVIRKLTMILFEHRSDLIALNPRSASISFPQVSNKNLGMPLHEGAQAHYNREKPSFLQAIALIITIVTIVVSLLLNLKSRFSEAQKNRADGYNLEIAILLEQIYSTDDKKELEKIRERLVNMFKRVIQDLDLDRLSPESYHLFVFPWEMAITALRHKEMILTEKEAASNINATILTTFAEVLATAHKERS